MVIINYRLCWFRMHIKVLQERLIKDIKLELCNMSLKTKTKDVYLPVHLWDMISLHITGMQTMWYIWIMHIHTF